MTLFDAGGGPAPASSPRLRLVVAYDGTDFHGFAGQRPDPETGAAVRTVEGTLVAALARVLRIEPDALGLVCAGRTDAGVHARGQVVTVDVPTEGVLDLDRLRGALNKMLGPEIVVRACTAAPEGFDARRSARWRTYRYTIVNRPEPDPFRARYAWWVPEPLEVAQLRLAADPFVGEHDFASFCRKGPEGSTTVRTVLSSRWLAPGLEEGVLTYEIRARAFCWQMVRSIVGTLVEAGAGRRRPGEMLAILHSGDRSHAGRLAPPHGLCLWEVGYEQ